MQRPRAGSYLRYRFAFKFGAHREFALIDSLSWRRVAEWYPDLLQPHAGLAAAGPLAVRKVGKAF